MWSGVLSFSPWVDELNFKVGDVVLLYYTGVFPLYAFSRYESSSSYTIPGNPDYEEPDAGLFIVTDNQYDGQSNRVRGLILGVVPDSASPYVVVNPNADVNTSITETTLDTSYPVERIYYDGLVAGDYSYEVYDAFLKGAKNYIDYLRAQNFSSLSSSTSTNFKGGSSSFALYDTEGMFFFKDHLYVICTGLDRDWETN